MDANKFNSIFQQCIHDYHIKDDINQPFVNKFSDFDGLLYEKCWIDTVQWHLEDIIRKPDIDPVEALQIKRKIDKLNQKRTDLVELIDDYIYNLYKNIKPLPDARMNTETPGWAIDRLSILNLKIYHWKEETSRPDASDQHKQKAKQKLNILLAQQQYLTKAINQLLYDLQHGKAIAQTYKQMKMYNDPELNPVLRQYHKKNSQKQF
jgi:hypothetical protein